MNGVIPMLPYPVMGGLSAAHGPVTYGGILRVVTEPAHMDDRIHQRAAQSR